MKKFAVLGIGVAIAALVLTGCGPTPAPSSSSGAPSPSVSASATPTPAPPTPDYGFTFFKQAQIGSTWAQMSAQLHYAVDGSSDCPWYGAVWNTEVATTYAFTNAMHPTDGVSFFYTSRYLSPDAANFPRNAEGVGVGSTQAQVVAAFPSAVVASVTDPGAGHIVTITVNDPSSSSKYVYGISDGSPVVDLLQWGPGAGAQWSHLCEGL